MDDIPVKEHAIRKVNADLKSFTFYETWKIRISQLYREASTYEKMHFWETLFLAKVDIEIKQGDEPPILVSSNFRNGLDLDDVKREARIEAINKLDPKYKHFFEITYPNLWK